MLSGALKWGALRAAEVFVLPSHQENFGIAVAEALSVGLPALISNKVNIWRELESDRAGGGRHPWRNLRAAAELLGDVAAEKRRYAGACPRMF